MNKKQLFARIGAAVLMVLLAASTVVMTVLYIMK